MWRLTLSACYGCRLFSPPKFLSFALLKHNPEIYLDEFQAWLEYQTSKLYAKQTGSRTTWQVGLSVISEGNDSRKRLAVRFLYRAQSLFLALGALVRPGVNF